MSNEMFTQLPTTTAATLSDIIAVVQGYTSPSNLGTSVQETLQQVLSLVTAGANISTTFSGGNLVISATGGLALGWTDVTGVSQIMSPNSGYVANNAGLVTLTLPTVAAFGSLIWIQGFGGGGWQVAQNVSQQIIIGNTASTLGTGGSIASTNQYDSILLLCANTNTIFTCLGGAQGNITIV
jgi:hypothetical protein